MIIIIIIIVVFYFDIRLYIISKYRSAAEVKNLYGSTVNS